MRGRPISLPEPVKEDTGTSRPEKFTTVPALPPPGTNVIVVTHRPNILDAFGKDGFEVKEGEASIFKPDGAGGYKLIARLQANGWSKLAQTGSN